MLYEVITLHARTFAERGNPPYFSLDFFREIARTMPEALMVKLATLGREPVACAIFLRGADTLYGRYWGAAGDFHSLHFEACYYQGIDYCIREGLASFEPGTQGEHKVARGFSPTPVWSMHRITSYNVCYTKLLRNTAVPPRSSLSPLTTIRGTRLPCSLP